MSEDELEPIREQKRERLAVEAERGDVPDEPVHVESVEQFSEVTADYGIGLVDFYADWCDPCNTLEPVVASIAEDTDAVVAKVDVDQHQALATQYGVRSVPTIVCSPTAVSGPTVRERRRTTRPAVNRSNS